MTVTTPTAGDGVAARLVATRHRVAAAERSAGRAAGTVRLLLATKTVPAELVRAALVADAAARQSAATAVAPVLVGENRVQELVAKAPALADLAPELHLIGPLQSNKVNHTLCWAACVQTVDSVELASRIGERAGVMDRSVDVMVQVNVSGEATKRGVAPELAADLAAAVAATPALTLRGFMTVGANSPDLAVVRAGYAGLREIRDAVLASAAPGTATATELSMGMTGDLEAAIAEGATIVRVGTAVFGARVG